MVELARMDDTEGEGEIVVTVERDIIDVDGDGVADVEREMVTTVVDVDGDGVPDIVQQTTTTGYDLDGDGVADIIESTTITGVDANRDGKFDADEVSIETRPWSAVTCSTRATRSPDRASVQRRGNSTDLVMRPLVGPPAAGANLQSRELGALGR